MCGIAGILMRERTETPSPVGLRRMSRVLVHRGPDAEGFWERGPAGLTHRRLSIIDLAGGHQPMSSAGRRDYSAWICCLLVLELWCRRFIDQAHAIDRTHPDPRVTHVAA